MGNFVPRVQRWTLAYLLSFSCPSYLARPFLQPRPCAKDVCRPHDPWTHIDFEGTELESAGGGGRLAAPGSPWGNTQGWAEKCKCVPRRRVKSWERQLYGLPRDSRILALLGPIGSFGSPPCGRRRGCRPRRFSRKRGSTGALKVSCI